MKKAKLFAVSALAVALGIFVAAAPGFAAVVPGLATYIPGSKTLSLNITTQDSKDVSDSITDALTDASVTLADVETVGITTNNPAWVAGGFVDHITDYGFTAVKAVNASVTGDISAAATSAIVAAIQKVPSGTAFTAYASGTADLSGVSDVSGISDFSIYAEGGIILPENADLETYAAALGLSEGQIIYQGDKTYEVQADGSIVEIEEATKAADTGVL